MQLNQTEKLALASGITLNWLALIFSYQDNPSFDDKTIQPLDPRIPETVYATGGFPLKAYDYPRPPMGPGPEQSELPFIGNLIFWILVAFVVFHLLKNEKLPVWFAPLMNAAAILSTVFSILYLLVKFD